MAQDRTATTVWEGDIKGNGRVSLDSSGLGAFDVSAPARFEAVSSTETSPEELIAAAHSSCFSMALAGILGRSGNYPERLETSAVVTVDKQTEGFAITKIALTLRGTVPGMSEEDFKAAADQAKTGCPVSKALASVPEITLDAALA